MTKKITMVYSMVLNSIIWRSFQYWEWFSKERVCSRSVVVFQIKNVTNAEKNMVSVM